MILRGPHRPDLIKDETLPDLLDATALRFPGKTALIFGEQSMTYAELNAAADRIACKLMAAGVKPGQVVGLWLPRGLELLIAQAGISKAGAAWLPFDADTPSARINTCMEDANSPGLLTCRALSAHPFSRPIWIIEELQASEDETHAVPRAFQP
jgi:non-ribosomal peptide synthetase component F